MSTAYHAAHDLAYGLAGRSREMIATNLEKANKTRSGALYTSRILKAGALIGDTKTLLSHWDVGATVNENVKRVHRDNVFGKASRSRVEDILAIFRRRYLSEESVTAALVTLARRKFPPASLERLLYFHSARADLLISDHNSRRTVSLQVKFSKDFLVTHMKPAFQKNLRACGWWTINRDKLGASPADFWVFVLLGFDRRSKDYVIVPPKELLRRLESIHGKQKTIQSYLWVTGTENCWETRGLSSKDQLSVAEGTYREANRNFTKWLNNWAPVERLNR